MSTPMNKPLPWPADAEPLPISALRPVLDRITSLAARHPEDAAVLPGAEVAEEEVAADPPPALRQLTDEFGGVTVRGLPMLTFQVEQRTDVGPYTLLGAPTTFYPLYETPDAAVVLTVAEDGAPGAVYGIGEDLALQLAASDLRSYLERFADALEATLHGLGERGPAAEDSADSRTDAAEQLMDEHLFGAVLGMRELEDIATVARQDPARCGIGDLAAEPLAVWDLRDAALDARADLMEVEVPDDPLALRVSWSHGGLVVTAHSS